jgi:hypothetical protein
VIQEKGIGLSFAGKSCCVNGIRTVVGTYSHISAKGQSMSIVLPIDISITITTVEENRYRLYFKAVGAPTLDYTQFIRVEPGAKASETVLNSIRTILNSWQSMHEAIRKGNHEQQNSDQYSDPT